MKQILRDLAEKIKNPVFQRDLKLRREMGDIHRILADNGYELKLYYRNKNNELELLYDVQNNYNSQTGERQIAVMSNVYKNNVSGFILNKTSKLFKLYSKLIKNHLKN